MPSSYSTLIPAEILEEFCYLRGKQNQALLQKDSLESDILYRLMAHEMARIYPPLIIPYVEITISPQCTLACKHCANLMQYYKKAQSMDRNSCSKTLHAFCDAVDHILTFRIMGGEPLMQKELPAFVEEVLSIGKIQHMQIVTNGTLLLPAGLIPLLQNPRCSVFISNYGPISKQRTALLAQCKSHKILTQSEDSPMHWQDMGEVQRRNIPQPLLPQIYDSCGMECRHLWNGEFHVCPRSAHGTALGLIPRRQGDYVPLLKNTVAENREQIRKLYEVPYVNACAYCNSGLN